MLASDLLPASLPAFLRLLSCVARRLSSKQEVFTEEKIPKANGLTREETVRPDLLLDLHP